MPTCLFILSRFTLRVDNVLFRTYDTRIYHGFASSPPLIVRETSGWEAPYEWVQRVCLEMLSASHGLIMLLFIQRLPKRDDLTPLTDPTWISRILADMPAEVSQQAGAGTRWRGLGTKTEIAVLNKVRIFISSFVCLPTHAISPVKG